LLNEIRAECERRGGLLMLVDLRPQPAKELHRFALLKNAGVIAQPSRIASASIAQFQAHAALEQDH